MRDRVDQRGDVVVVHPGADEAQLVLGVGVSRRQPREHVVDLGLGHPGREPDFAVEPHLGGELGKQLVDRRRADLRQHLAAVGVRG